MQLIDPGTLLNETFLTSLYNSLWCEWDEGTPSPQHSTITAAVQHLAKSVPEPEFILAKSFPADCFISVKLSESRLSWVLLQVVWFYFCFLGLCLGWHWGPLCCGVPAHSQSGTAWILVCFQVPKYLILLGFKYQLLMQYLGGKLARTATVEDCQMLIWCRYIAPSHRYTGYCHKN